MINSEQRLIKNVNIELMQWNGWTLRIEQTEERYIFVAITLQVGLNVSVPAAHLSGHPADLERSAARRHQRVIQDATL